jgi:hypothetical protein
MEIRVILPKSDKVKKERRTAETVRFLEIRKKMFPKTGNIS